MSSGLYLEMTLPMIEETLLLHDCTLSFEEKLIIL
jgi:hypothetical protein